MRMKQNFRLIAISILFINTICLPNLFAQFAGGSGTQANPWQIATAEHLDYVRNYLGVEHSTKHFIQIADIDLGVSPWNEGEGWQPIGSRINGTTSSFTGSYDGNGHIIRGLYINRPDQTSIGLFGSTYGATITNLGVVNVDVSGEALVGGLIGDSEWSYIINSYSTGNILAESTLIFSSAAGGLIGGISNSFVSSSYNVSTVTAFGSGVGGFIGNIFESTIENCFSNSIVDGSFVGGFIGESIGSTINNCYSTGYANIGDTSGFAYLIHYSIVNNCYSFTVVNGDEKSGFVMSTNQSVVENCYWDIEVSGTTVSAVGEGRTTTEMTYPYADNTFVSWDFINTWSADENYDVNNGYPYLREMPVSVDDELSAIIKPVKLFNYPNPFNPETTIFFTLLQPDRIRLEIFNIRGQKIKTLVDDYRDAGQHRIVWNGTNDRGERVSSGVYFYRLSINNVSNSEKMLLLK